MSKEIEEYKEENEVLVWDKLTEEEQAIVGEYLMNGFKRKQAYQKFRDYHKNEHSLAMSAQQFFTRPIIKQAIKQRQDYVLGNRDEMLNELLHDLRYNIFYREVEGEYTYKDRQKDIELLIKITGIDRAPKFKDDIKSTLTATQVVIDILGDERGYER